MDGVEYRRSASQFELKLSKEEAQLVLRVRQLRNKAVPRATIHISPQRIQIVEDTSLA